MSNQEKGSGTRTIPSNARGGRTRDRLLDSLETLAAQSGIDALSHRAIARHARLHSGLIHYHFGTVEQLLEEALARRAPRLAHVQIAAITEWMARGSWTVEDIVAALWQPFGTLGGALEGGWRNYLCLVARLASHERGEELLDQAFGDVARAAERALQIILPDTDEAALRAGLRFTRVLFEQEALGRCRNASPAERRIEEDRRLVAFAAAGIRELAGRAKGRPHAPLRASAG